MIFSGDIKEGAAKVLPKLFGVCDVNWKIHLTAWIFALFSLAIRPLTNRIPITAFDFMDKIDLETKHGSNCVTRWADKANDQYSSLNSGTHDSGVWDIHQGEAGYKSDEDDKFDKVDTKGTN